MSNNIKVDLIAYTPNPLDVVYTAMRCCYYSGTPNQMFTDRETYSEENKLKLVKKVVTSGHLSTIEHVSLTFAISGIDRNCTHQLVRKRIASYSQQSLRYTNIAGECTMEELQDLLGNDNDEIGVAYASKYYTDVTADNWRHYMYSLIAYLEMLEIGAKKEEARNMLCSNIRTNIVMTVNLRSFIDLLNHRCCSRAQLPIRRLANAMMKEVKKTGEFKFVESMMGPKCKVLGFCDEENTCGRSPLKKDVVKYPYVLSETEDVQ